MARALQSFHCDVNFRFYIERVSNHTTASFEKLTLIRFAGLSGSCSYLLPSKIAEHFNSSGSRQQTAKSTGYVRLSNGHVKQYLAKSQTKVRFELTGTAEQLVRIWPCGQWCQSINPRTLPRPVSPQFETPEAIDGAGLCGQ